MRANTNRLRRLRGHGPWPQRSELGPGELLERLPLWLDPEDHRHGQAEEAAPRDDEQERAVADRVLEDREQEHPERGAELGGAGSEAGAGRPALGREHLPG